ncbi:hypothetical protein CXG81DRAFT_17063 [Caulochytrium protostelioides]|uniref:Dynein heavy chain, cytoplasmic n=1 Tax=Caulochytrium protostelioides TaxID=1555241 RepID=A0A4P9XDB8_9FUNG|nr:hypothetical protein CAUPRSCDRAFT_10206 [Caulochytrium protostelioides]RKP03442.1 hypothetical protein CXG81DRAFT_17063 [Caulochytrium protostelioides]|eukprot:RKP03442.1 hypothetical protein CXG81DRAFT_17063 [Caulochytrium protostelioides]
MSESKKDDAATGGAVASDGRFAFFEEKVCSAFKLKPDKWQKMLVVPDNAQTIADFLDKHHNALVFYINQKDELVSSFVIPSNVSTKKRCLYWVKKRQNAPLTEMKFDNELIDGGLSGNPLDFLSELLEDVYIPVLANQKNFESWPKVLANDVVTRFHQMNGAVTVIAGQSKGKTMLPLPAQPSLAAKQGTASTGKAGAHAATAAAAGSTIASPNYDELSALETSIINWTHQIRKVVASRSGEALEQGLNPGPIVELDFWAAKTANLEGIFQQLKDTQIQTIAQVLTAHRSPYAAALQDVTAEVERALDETRDINGYLKSLRNVCERLTSSSDLQETAHLFPTIMHILVLVTRHSKYYHTPEHLSVILQELANEVIQQAHTFIGTAELFQGEFEESMERLHISLQVCEAFKRSYFDAQAESARQPGGRPWQIRKSMVFARFDAFQSRVAAILNVFETIVEFNRLEKIEIGGTRGKMLTLEMMTVFNEFMTVLRAFATAKYDILDMSLYQFDADLAIFHQRVMDLDKRMATILCQAFDDCSGLSGCFRLLESFSGLLSRQAIQEDFVDKFQGLLKMFDEDLDDVVNLFNSERDHPPIHCNMPPTTGALTWASELRDRIERRMERVSAFQSFFGPDKDVTEAIFAKYQRLHDSIAMYEQSVFEQWAGQVGDIAQTNLSKPLLVYKDGSATLIAINFDPNVITLLREMRYFEHLTMTPPVAAQDIYAKSNVFRDYIFRLDHVANMLNQVRTNVLDVEQPLIEGRLKAVDAQISRGLHSINWNSGDVDAYINEIHESVSSLNAILQQVKANVSQIRDTMASWSRQPLIERRDTKKALNIEDEQGRVNATYDQIRRDGKMVHELLSNSQALLDVSPSSEHWIQYKRYVNDITRQGFVDAIRVSLESIANNMTAQGSDVSPYLEAKLELGPQGLVLTPAPDVALDNNLIRIASDMIDDVYEMAALMGRIVPPEDDGIAAFEAQHHAAVTAAAVQAAEGGEANTEEDCAAREDELAAHLEAEIRRMQEENESYIGEIKRDATLSDLADLIRTRIAAAAESCIAYRQTYDRYAYLWTESRAQYMERFLNEPPAETTAADGSDESAAPSAAATAGAAADATAGGALPLDRFEQQIRKFESIHKTIMAMDPDVLINGWFRIDAKPLKQSLNVVVKKWSFSLTKHLSDATAENLLELHQFVKANKSGLQVKIEEGDLQGLVKIMGLLHGVKQRTGSIDSSLDSMRKTINLLRQFGVEMPEESHRLLAELPEAWTEVKKLSVSIKDHVAPLQAKEVELLQQRCNRFETRNYSFREEFRRRAPLGYIIGPDAAYELMDAAQFAVTTMETEAAELRTSCELFELSTPSYRQLADCRRDLTLLKTVWDLVALVNGLFSQWRSTLWTAIDTEILDTRCRDLAKELRRMDKEVKGWDVYQGVDQAVKDMMTSLRAVGELRSSAIRERHWRQLMKATGVTFVMTADLRFQDLLSLQLHKFEDEVKGIVDRASKELAMEKVLVDLDKTWKTMEFIYEVHASTKTPLLKSSETMVEVLEDNQVMLQTMMSSKYIAHFEEEISRWQNILSTVDSVTHLWLEVQQTWSHLENIFMGSEDIRAQLPEDSKRFDSIDGAYKQLMKEAAPIPYVIEVCMRPGLYEKLENLQGNLALCEKSLAEYLETKRLAFPRFYFVSASDLLDILAKGNLPTEVAVHLSKLFDSLSGLEFQKDPVTGENTKTAIGMYSQQDEYVAFSQPCECTGPVEVWLNRLVDTMRATLRYLLGEAVTAYEEKPREQWIFDYPAQITIAGTGVWWASEVNAAFARLEEGYENSLKDYYKKQVNQLTALINLIQGDLTPGNRQMIMTVCTLDVHARDIVAKLITEKADSAQCFAWQSQLRLRWDDVENDCFINICDAQFRYSYEYLGNTPRLVVTALTDRCYITLSQSLHLIMGGAPAGPAGTGKTETVKDLAKALALQCFVFNCSEQMDYKSVGNIFKGLAQSGTWGCFDEFNRISVEVLSVIATQVKSIQDALRAKKKRFIFQGEEISLVSTVGAFITMNPGYAGRTELPENIKALFRPCSMVVPNLELICEIMLMAEGFIQASGLARKFNTLYKLNRELLSKQDHYDWGLRAIKSVLVVAGSLKRSDPSVPEEHVLMRALRDFNLPKIVTDDLQVFHGLIGDLFPKVEVLRKRDEQLESNIRRATVESGLQAEDIFVLKVVQLEELMAVRHCVFIIGNGGTGKSQVWKMLAKTYQNTGRKCTTYDLNPKAVTTDDLFGYINPSTREWKDGLFSSILRDMASTPGTDPKWMILDGDIDPNWIESLNTVMDDNKMLTLASNERIPLKPHLRLIFEIADLKYATPATVSRAGILYISASDLGWNPHVQSWLDKREDATEKSALSVLFDRFVNPCLEVLRSGRFKMANVEEFSLIVSLCNILEGLLIPENVPKGCDKEWYEIYFGFAVVWAFGGPIITETTVDYKAEFSKWFHAEFKQNVKFPVAGTVFDYYIDHETKRFVNWSERIPKYQFDPEEPLSSVMVHTSETIRIRYLLDVLADNGKPVLLIGNAGSGKTVLMQEKLRSYPDDRLIVNVPFNFYTTAWSLQAVLEKPLEKKAGRNYGPPGNKKIIYFLDDLNMPEVDKYGTASPHTLLRQHLDYKHWYDRQKLTLKEIHNCQYVACMNPTAGSFTISGRLSRHFASFTVNFPMQESLQSIYSQILGGHLKSFSPSISKLGDRLVAAGLLLHKRVSSAFLPTAVKFHYTFNLRDLSNIFQGMLYAQKDAVRDAVDLVRLFLHEANRTYGDKMITPEDRNQLSKIQEDVFKKSFEELDQTAIKSEPNLWSHFAGGLNDPKYGAMRDWPTVKRLLEEAQTQYDETNAAMGLVLFEDAMAHICRINRILESPRGNALLVGVGGSGKQSLARLSAFISNMDDFQITIRKGYSMVDLKTDIAALYIKAGQKKQRVMFLLTDAQIADERFLVVINDILASGDVPSLFPDDEVDGIINSMRNECKALGLMDTREMCWELFIRNVRRNLKVVLCFSPVGNTLRSRCRKFPAIVNQTMIDWFQEWPEEALQSVAARFIANCDLVPDDLKGPVTHFMSFAHQSVTEISRKYLVNEKRYNYTTPKSFLALISIYKEMLEKKSGELIKSMERLENGLTKLQSTAEQVDDLKSKLASQEVELTAKNAEAERLIQRVGLDTEQVNKEKAIAAEEERKVDVITKEVTEKQMACEKDLQAAEPALAAAANALNTLNKANLTELKSFGSPSDDVVNVVAAVMVLLSPPGKIAKDRSWKAGKNMMAKVDSFLESLISFNKEAIDKSNLDAIDPYLANPNFNENYMRSKSVAAAGLCSWAVNIVGYYRVYCDVEPKRRALEAANAELHSAQARLAEIQAKIAELDGNLGQLRAQFEKATADKMKCEEEAKATQDTIGLANRLVGGLASEKVRWSESVARFKEQEKTLAGDVLLASTFVSYMGCFSKRYREELLTETWLKYLEDTSNPHRVPISEGLDPLSLLTSSADVAKWNNEGLPTDRVSLENATMVISCKRWPLIIDPQLQGVTWIKNREGKDLRIIRLGQKGYLDAIEKAITNGETVLLEDIAESIDPVLNSVLGRETIKKGRYMRLGDKEVEYDHRFKLIMQTRLANPHYPPEIQAQTTLINFTVTLSGLEDQLLADVVNTERPDLEKTKAELTKQQNEFKIRLTELEDSLLSRLSSASGNFLGDTSLVESLEITKSTALDIEQKVEEAKRTEKKINETREQYRPVAARSSLLYFLLNDLWQIHPMYQYSLNAYKVVFQNAIARAEQVEDLKERVSALIVSITHMIFVYITRGLFERDKLIFAAQMTFQILAASDDLDLVELDFLLRGPSQANATSPIEWLSHQAWGMIKTLSNLEVFRSLASDIEGSSKQWKKYWENEAPENEKLPQEWKNKTPLQKLCILRCLRPDRMAYAVKNFIHQKMGPKYVDSSRVPFPISFQESSPGTPIFFILSPGVDPVKEVEALGRQIGFTEDRGNYHYVSLGQGQEVIAEQKLDLAYQEGGWVMLENIHLLVKWLPILEKKLEVLSMGSHPDFRVFLSAEPASDPAYHIIPISILQASIKITNEPPSGMQANIHRALDNFSQESLERSAKDSEFRAVTFALSYFHAVVLERRKFGTQGWNRSYPFSTGDLMICFDVLYNYLENFAKVPWTDLRYIFGEIMYGGHISDDWDRRLCSAYLDVYVREELLEGMELAPGFPAPPSSDIKEYHRYVDETLPAESPSLYGLHPNAEIGVLTKSSEKLFRTLLEMQPRQTSGGQGTSKEEKVKAILDEILEKLPENFNIPELMAKVEERTPYISVALQECDRMTILMTEMRRSLKELDLGLKGDLTITEKMESLMNAMYLNEVPDSWTQLAYPSLAGLAAWYANLLQRIKELDAWVGDFQLPSVVWLPGLFNPQSFLTAIMQTTARKNEWPLDRMVLTVDVTKKAREEFSGAPREGAYIHGLFMEGARWDNGSGAIQESLIKDLVPSMPVIYIRAVPIDKRETKSIYECPVYRTRQRGPTFVWTFNLKTKERPQKWILGGVCLLCSTD